MNGGAIEKVLWLLKDHKTKTLSGMALVGVLSVLRYAKSSGQAKKIFDLIKGKLEKKMRAKLKEREKQRKMTHNFEELYQHFLSLNKGIKRNLQRDISAIFDIESLKESIRAKNVSDEERGLLLEELKGEVLLHAIFSIIYISISRVILFIRECILNKHEAMLENEPEKNLLVLESFFSDFSEFIIRNSGKSLYSYLKNRLQSVFCNLQVQQKYKESDLLDLMTQICGIVTEVYDENPLTPMPNDEAIGNDTTFIDVNGISGLLREEKIPVVLDKGRTKRDIVFPQFQIRVLKAFTKTTEGHRIIENIDYFIRYFYTGGQDRDEKSHGLCGIAEVEEEDEKEESVCGKKGHQGVKKNGILVIDLEEEETKASDDVEIEGEENKKRVLKAMKVASDEFLDLIECGNFNLYGLYAINFEMKKLMNRISMCLRKKGIQEDGVTLLAFLPILHKIISEEVLDENAEELNNVFYNSQIKIALAAVNKKEVNSEELNMECRIMEEFEMKKIVDSGFKEFGRTIFIEKMNSKN